MAIIKRDGLFRGDRLRDCGELARMWWPWFYAAANGFGRLEVNYDRMRRDMFGAWEKKAPLTRDEVRKIFMDYHRNFLAYCYQSDGQIWAQFETESANLPRHKTAADRKSPEPPPEIEKWREQYELRKRARAVDNLDGWEIVHATKVVDHKPLPKLCEDLQKSAEDFGKVVRGVGVGVGVGGGGGVGEGVGDGKIQTSSSAASAEPIAGTLPLIDGSNYEVTKSEEAMWQGLFPAVEVKQAFRNMKAWLIVHEKNRKTPRGIKRFIQQWLSREQDRARPGGGGNGKESAIERVFGAMASEDGPAHQSRIAEVFSGAVGGGVGGVVERKI